MIQKTFMLSHHEIMWIETWPNLLLKMKDMPYWKYKSSGKRATKSGDDHEIHDDLEVLKTRFGKFQKR